MMGESTDCKFKFTWLSNIAYGNLDEMSLIRVRIKILCCQIEIFDQLAYFRIMPF
jgi:hypothetical protein